MNAEPETLRFVVDDDEAGERVDVALAVLSGESRAQIRRWIDAGRVVVDGEPARPSRRVALGEVVEAQPPAPVRASALPQAIALVVLYEDDDLIVVDKPAGMVVHPAPGHASGTLVNALLYHCGDLAQVGGVLRPGIVHRLDRGTSGVMVAAKTDAAHASLARHFHDHTIERVYEAFVRGLPGKGEGRIDRPIGRHPRDRKRMSVRTHSGREARTAWRVLTRYAASGCAHVEIRPETGRTHQIRVHLASVGMPVMGDPVYGRGRATQRDSRLDPGRPALHARVLGFAHPRHGDAMRFEAALPADLTALEQELARRERVGSLA